jgi:CRP-like cAMP-binding protein
MFHLLLQSVRKHINLTEEEETFFTSLFQKKQVRKKQFLLQEGEAAKYLMFVNDGCLRSYSIDKNGFEHILQFAPPGWWITDMYSITTQQSASLYIDVIFDGEILMISNENIDKLFEQLPQFNKYFRILAENSLVTYQRRLIDNLSLSALERYEGFCKYYPSLIETLPQKQVAAYIGVTPEFLSKMLNSKMPARQ